MTYAPDHPRHGNNGYIREHIRVWMEANGAIPNGHVIHHLNGIKQDNRIENLALLLIKNHRTTTIIDLLQKRIQALESMVAAHSDF